MLPEELAEDLKRIGFRVQRFTVDKVTGGTRVAKLILKARRGQLSAEDRRTAHEVASFNLPGVDIRYTPLSGMLSDSVTLFWVV